MRRIAPSAPPILVLLALLAAAAAGASGSGLRGRVVDPRGSPVAGARVTLRTASGSSSISTDPAGRFRFESRDGGVGTLSIEAAGFASSQRPFSMPEDGDAELRIELLPAYSETVAVSASRTETRLAESPASVAVRSGEDLASAPAAPLDEALRSVPGFTLFRRADSRSANPTAQGVSLRGVGGSGASRAAVLDDGVPITDPFGGWVAWGRVPRVALERVEVLRGGASDLYGGAALAGAISLIRRPTDEPRLAVESSLGSRDTSEASLFAAGRRGAWSGSAAAEWFRTGGYVPVEESERGPVDRESTSRHETAELTLERSVAENGRVFLRGSSFLERRDNGTQLQDNDTALRQLAAGTDWALAGGGAGSVRIYAGREIYHQTFSAISSDRTEEFLTRRQRVPSEYGGLTAQLSRAFGAHLAVAGVEGRTVRGSSDELSFSRAGGATPSDAGGRERSAAVFVEDVFSAGSRLVVVGALRADSWKSVEGFRSAGAGRGQFPDRSETVWSPRLSALYRVGARVSLTGSAYRSFRAPTLNELYRSFRLGDTLTLANERLRPEVLSGGEAGAVWASPAAGASGRATLFWMEVDHTIANVTLSSEPGLITRQRQNLGRTRSRGFEVEARLPVGGSVTLEAAYLYADSTVRSFDADTSLVGRRVAQVPRHQGSIRARAALGGAVVVLEARAVGAQFDDDRNAFRLPGFGLLGAFVGVPLCRGLQFFAAGENLLGARYEVARTPTVSVGSPRFVRAGVRLALPAPPR